MALPRGAVIFQHDEPSYEHLVHSPLVYQWALCALHSLAWGSDGHSTQVPLTINCALHLKGILGAHFITFYLTELSHSVAADPACASKGKLFGS